MSSKTSREADGLFLLLVFAGVISVIAYGLFI